MSTQSTQRFVGMFVALVVAVLLLIALPFKPDGADPAPQAHQATGLTDPRDVVPVFEVIDGWWVLTRYGVRMRLPQGWIPLPVNDRPHAFRQVGKPALGSLNVLSFPNFFHRNLDSVADENESSLLRNERLELVSIERRELGGGLAALRIDYEGRPADTDMRFAAIVFLLGGHQVVITAASGAAQWEDVEAQVAEALASIELLDLPTMELDELLELAGPDPGAR